MPLGKREADSANDCLWGCERLRVMNHEPAFVHDILLFVKSILPSNGPAWEQMASEAWDSFRIEEPNLRGTRRRPSRVCVDNLFSSSAIEFRSIRTRIPCLRSLLRE